MRTQEVGRGFGGSSCPGRRWAGAWEDGTGQSRGLPGKVVQLAEPTHGQLGALGKLQTPLSLAVHARKVGLSRRITQAASRKRGNVLEHWGHRRCSLWFSSQRVWPQSLEDRPGLWAGHTSSWPPDR